MKETSALGRLMIKPVEKAHAKEMIIKNHYSHKWNDGVFGVFNFGIFHADEPNRCLEPTCVAVQGVADGRLGCGTIYKASNFRYYVFHYIKFLHIVRSCEMVHEQIFTNSHSPSGLLRANVGILLGDFD